MSAELNAIAETISMLRKIYCASAVDDYGNVVIGESQYPDFFKELLVHTGKLERVLASSLTQTKEFKRADALSALWFS